MRILIRWLFQHKSKRYKYTYFARGYLGNKYEVGTFEFKVSENTINKTTCQNPREYGFMLNSKKLDRHFPKRPNGSFVFCTRDELGE